MLRFDALVFDFDGVLVESVDVKTRAFASLYAEHGPQMVAKVVAYHLAHGGVSRFEKFRHFHQAFLNTTLSAAEEAALGARFSELVEDAVVAAPWIPGALEFLEAFHRRLRLFVASGTPEDELERILTRRGMRHYFSSTCGAPARKSAIIAGFTQNHTLDRSRVLMIGDSLTDYQEAMQAGVSFLGIASGTTQVLPQTVAVMPDLLRLAEFVTGAAP